MPRAAPVVPAPGSGNNDSINSHCSSLTRFCHFFMTDAQQHNRLKCKYRF